MNKNLTTKIILFAALSLLPHRLLSHSVDLEVDLSTLIPDAVHPAEDSFISVVEGVIDQFKLWQTGSTVSGCFFGGTESVRGAFYDAAAEWERYANIQIDLGSFPKFRDCSGGEQLRISFQPLGNWSYVGTDSIRVDLSKPSMNIQNGNAMGANVNDAKAFRSTVLHEIGHFLGMQHEHQSPVANCDKEFDWDTIYINFHEKYGWDKRKVDTNLRQLVKSKRLRTTEYDKDSIMHYYFAPWMFKNGDKSSCYTHKNFNISSMDSQAISAAYPKTASEQLQLVQSRLDSTKDMLGALTLTDEEKTQIVDEINSSIQASFPASGLSISFQHGDVITTGDKSPVLKGVDTGGGDIKIEY